MRQTPLKRTAGHGSFACRKLDGVAALGYTAEENPGCLVPAALMERVVGNGYGSVGDALGAEGISS
jgi:hypothetical protein